MESQAVGNGNSQGEQLGDLSPLDAAILTLVLEDFDLNGDEQVEHIPGLYDLPHEEDGSAFVADLERVIALGEASDPYQVEYRVMSAVVAHRLEQIQRPKNNIATDSTQAEHGGSQEISNVGMSHSVSTPVSNIYTPTNDTDTLPSTDVSSTTPFHIQSLIPNNSLKESGSENPDGALVRETFEPFFAIPPMSRLSWRKSAVKNLVRIFKADWKDLRDNVDKAHRAFVTADQVRPGISLSFTLNLSEKRQETLRQHVRPARAMSHEINRALKDVKAVYECELPYAFVFEVSNTEKLHIHGFIIPTVFDEAHFRSIDQALMRAGGHLTGAHQLTKDSQNVLGWLYDGHGYFEYATKAPKRLLEYFGGRDINDLVFISGPMRRLCGLKEDT